ncbi:MAG: hypothetical protein DRG58_11815 [Deltaproteobacteria bacterium]|nr:MAG: hypothetical protein DRG58_11815 [Deltaproteobacteria bacterium]
MKISSYLSRRRYFVAVMVGIVMTGFISFLIGQNFLAHVELQKLTLKNLRQDVEKRAAAGSYFYSERQQDLIDLAHSRELSYYFENKALGMSMEYGLRFSLIDIQRRFARLQGETLLGNDRIYTRIVFIERSGKCLVDSQATDIKAPGNKDWQSFLAPESSEPVILVEPLEPDLADVMISTPFYFKGTYAGQIVAWVSNDTLCNHLIAGGPEASNLVLQIILWRPDKPFLNICKYPEPVPAMLSDLGQVKIEGTQGIVVVQPPGREDKIIALWVSIKDTPFYLLGVLPASTVFGPIAPWRLMVALGSLALLLLGGMGILYRADTRNLALQARLVEAAKRERELIEDQNRQLEAEIVERKLTERGLRESEQKYRELADLLPQSVFECDVWGTLTFANRESFKTFGYSQEEFDQGLNLLQMIVPAEQDRARRNLRQILAGNHLTVGQFTAIRKNGSTFPITVYSNPIIKGNQPVGLRGILIDISERKQAEELLKLNEARLEALLQVNQMTEARLPEITEFAMEEAIRLTQSQLGYIAFVDEDKSILTMHAWPKNAIQACRIEDKPQVYPVETTGLWGEAVRQRRPIITNDYSAPNLWEKGYPEGHVEIRRQINVPIFDGNQVVLVAGVGNKTLDYDESDVRQLTLLMEGMWRIIQRKRAQEQIQASLQEKEVLLKEIHHRVKNNLQIICSLLKLQAGYIDDSKIQAVIQDSQNRIRIMALVHELLYQSPDLAMINLMSYIKTLVGALSRTYLADPGGIALKLAVDDIRLGIDTAIPCGLIINELVSNSLKYAFPDKRQGVIQINFHAKPDQDLELVVRDNGVGLPETLDLRNGNSLGLRLVKILAEDQLQGKISLNRTKGTEFIIEFAVKH